MATIHGQNNHVQLKYIQKNGLRNKFTVHLDTAIATVNTKQHLQMSTGVNCKREDFRDSKEKSPSLFNNGFGAPESDGAVELEYEHLSERRGRIILEFEVDNDEKTDSQRNRLSKLETTEREHFEEVLISLELFWASKFFTDKCLH